MNQKIAVALFASGLPIFLTISTEMLERHTWGDLIGSPLGAVHLLIVGGAFVTLVIGSLGIQLPRDKPGPGERTSDSPDGTEASPKKESSDG